MKKRILSAVLAFLFALGAVSAAFAMDEGDWRVVFGADLTAEEREEVLKLFGLSSTIEQDPARVLTVTISEERFYLDGKVPSDKIGQRSISSIFIRALPEGSGVKVSTHNISYCTAEMYESILATVGITDAEIVVASPRPVSGTAALTGIYKAYESMTGSLISEYIKRAGFEEMLTTWDIAEVIGSDEATEVIIELKKILDVTQTMSDDEVKECIRTIANDNDVVLTEEQVGQILTLGRTLEGLDVEQIRQRALGLANAVSGWQKFADGVSKVFEDIGNFLVGVAEFFANIFNDVFSAFVKSN
ncbi:MAG: DUF1002 domain-containing protein [Clostridia bacterium]|nr:DUF1002 domain-containing protein [Clostridia bacterium]